jgi:DNA repair protein RadD
VRTLHPHQERAIAMLKRSLGTGHRRPVVQAPTGFGKTVLAGAIVRGALAKGKRIMFVVPAISLIDQTVQSFASEGIRNIGVVQADHPMTNYAMPVQVASAQTISRRARMPEVDLVVIDECHRWFRFYETWMADWNAIPFIGLSATPWTKGMGKHFDDLVIASTTQELIDAGFL